MAIYGGYLIVGQPLGEGTIGLGDTAALWRSAPYVIPLLALGLLVSSAFSTVRTAVVCFLVAVAALVALEALTLWLRIQPPQDLSLSVLYLRSGLDAAGIVLSRISPVSYFADLVTSTMGISVLMVSRAVAAAVLVLVMFGLSVMFSKRKGPQ
jgi:hypothetical protein